MVDAEAVLTLDRVAAAMEASPSAMLRLDVHTHDRAGSDTTERLVDDRTQSVIDGLIQRGIDVGRVRVETEGGAGHEVADHRQPRVELTLVPAAGAPAARSDDKAECQSREMAPPDATLLGEVDFAPGTSRIVRGGGAALRRPAAQASKGVVLVLVVYTVPGAAPDAALDLARERAAVVRAELSDLGVDDDHMRISVHAPDPGSDRPPDRLELRAGT